jgi:Rad3-related DNA helicase
VRGCKFKNNVKKLCKSEDITPGGSLEVWDIEDLVEMGNLLQSCPYYSAKHLAQVFINNSNKNSNIFFCKEVDLILCPYNYILSPSIRESMEIVLTNSIIIIDEAQYVIYFRNILY